VRCGRLLRTGVALSTFRAKNTGLVLDFLSNCAGITHIHGSAGSLIDDFWPDINRKLFDKHPKSGFASAP
jgi:hypothetical protein